MNIEECVKLVVKYDREFAWEYDEDDGVTIKLVGIKKMKLVLMDDNVPETCSKFRIIISDRRTIEELTIIINSGKYHDKGYPFETSQDTDYESVSLYLECAAQIGKLTIKQHIKTEHIYSYYGNQEGFQPAEIKIIIGGNVGHINAIDGNISLRTNETQSFMLDY